MADLPPYPDSNGDSGARPGREYPGIPRWVKVSVIIAIGLVLLVVVVLLVATALGLHTPPGGPGEHGPPRHSPSGADLDGRTSYSIIIEDLISSSGNLGSQIPPSSVTEDYLLSGSDLSGQTPPSSLTEHGVQQL